MGVSVFVAAGYQGEVVFQSSALCAECQGGAAWEQCTITVVSWPASFCQDSFGQAAWLFHFLPFVFGTGCLQ